MDDYKLLADMSNRTACPRCEGYGFIHGTLDKHDKPAKVKCKKCEACDVCEGSGVTFGKDPCNGCGAKGFVHPEKAYAPHSTPSNIRCIDCVDCKVCQGKAVLDRKSRAAEATKSGAGPKSAYTDAKSFLPQQPLVSIAGASGAAPGSFGVPVREPRIAIPPAFNPPIQIIQGKPNPFSMAHPHLVSGLGFGPKELAVFLGKNQAPALPTSVLPEHLQTTKCPKCEGAGWRHESSIRHDTRATVRCKNCVACRGCRGEGTITGKTICPTCQLKGYNHASTERPHDAPANLRCFFCKDCSHCKGIGLVDMATLGNLPPLTPIAGPGATPYLPAAPLLNLANAAGQKS
ncbi:uncharacterized protein BJ171DRAFT_485005 [Polychytrium aggregatum]|uniref:uncharacterized protein n=1 Tax=Polychytrium aggregatum TaxID=110093 RepID=UPI0022FEE7CB|nr:uncharacterized protein BJ171DRAFT_485005 [Polychytrium aggregatum]KAI9209780.1 hypothetical protein BJ171DRAFT_485005 [Polychytrium aggregatum]